MWRSQPWAVCTQGKFALVISGNLTGTRNLRTWSKGQTHQLRPCEGTSRAWADSPGLSDPSCVPAMTWWKKPPPRLGVRVGVRHGSLAHRGRDGPVSGPQMPCEKMWLMVTVSTSQKWDSGPSGFNMCLYLPSTLQVLHPRGPAPPLCICSSPQRRSCDIRPRVPSF